MIIVFAYTRHFNNNNNYARECQQVKSEGKIRIRYVARVFRDF